MNNSHVMQNIVVRFGLPLMVLVLPALASAQRLENIFNTAAYLLNALIGIFITLAILVFFWGLIQYLISVGEEKSKGLQIMFYGVIAIFVMVSIWGIIRVLQNTLGVGNNQPIVPGVIQPYR